MRRKLVKVVALGALAFAAVAPAKALQFGLDFVFNGSQNNVVPPLATGTFTDVAGGVQLTLQSVGLAPDQFLAAIYLNLNTTLNAANLNFAETASSGVANYAISHANDSFKADGDGFFDFVVDFQQSGVDRFQGGDSLTLLITGISGLSAQDFNFVSVGGPVSGFFMVGHFSSQGGAWIADADGDGGGSGGPVPEPSTYLVLASFIGLAVYLKRRLEKPALVLGAR